MINDEYFVICIQSSSRIIHHLSFIIHHSKNMADVRPEEISAILKQQLSGFGADTTLKK
jgi:hypothetical protein